MFYYVALDLLFVYAFSNKGKLKRKTSWKTRFLIVVGISILVAAFVLVTGADRVWNTIYLYSCGCVTLLDVKLQEFDVIGIHTYGFTSLNGFFRPIATLLRSLTGVPLHNSVALAEKYLLMVEKPVPITTNGGFYNGFVSLFYPFFIDAGFIGVIIGSAVWGYVCERVYLKYKLRGAEIDIFLYLLILQAIAISMTRFAFVTYQYALAFVYFAAIFRKNKTHHNENRGHIPR
jgi:oligosaccharide repeat unit polymerase